jgi:hypothetical protein
VVTREQLGLLDELAKLKADETALGKRYEKEIALTKALLARCGEATDCFVAMLAEAATNTDAGRTIGVNAAYHVGVIGDRDAARKLGDALESLTHPSVRFAALTVIDASSPHGNPEIARKLREMSVSALASNDAARVAFNSMHTTFINRLETRASPWP